MLIAFRVQRSSHHDHLKFFAGKIGFECHSWTRRNFHVARTSGDPDTFADLIKHTGCNCVSDAGVEFERYRESEMSTHHQLFHVHHYNRRWRYSFKYVARNSRRVNSIHCYE